MTAVTVTVVGVGADGWDGLSPSAQEAIRRAKVLMGSERQLALVPDTAAERVRWPSPMLPALPALMAAHPDACVLASGDPMFYGIGATLVRLLGPENVTVVPHPSSLSLACAGLGWALDEVAVVSAVGRSVAAVHPEVQPGRKVLVLSADARTPAEVAALLTARGYGDSRLWVLEQLAGPARRTLEGRAASWENAVVDGLNVVAVECDREGPVLARTPGLPDDAYDHDGQLTKREIRAVTLARLAPVPGQLLWDVGAGAGSIGIEWMRHHRSCRAVAVESDPERAARIGRNAEALGVPGLTIVVGAAPEALHHLERPDAVFVGGGATVPGVVEICWQALLPGGRLVVNTVTVESEGVVAGWHQRLGGELVRIAINRAGPLGGFTGWRPQLPVTQWAITKGTA
ncbi:precorrin-6y C5,15-methyltransferase (decarboxylating) subunit CbiE [Fodinicola feengrottensis]|uniref:Precorrin-6y C5,15-methyltransferase (Decarboxylating) subunit CbiE n=1 Tax=Fodinicola feengrottensis TaxID=435914 RepID=A0ABN2I0E6_9ACTN